MTDKPKFGLNPDYNIEEILQHIKNTVIECANKDYKKFEYYLNAYSAIKNDYKNGVYNDRQNNNNI